MAFTYLWTGLVCVSHFQLAIIFAYWVTCMSVPQKPATIEASKWRFGDNSVGTDCMPTNIHTSKPSIHMATIFHLELSQQLKQIVWPRTFGHELILIISSSFGCCCCSRTQHTHSLNVRKARKKCCPWDRPPTRAKSTKIKIKNCDYR